MNRKEMITQAKIWGLIVIVVGLLSYSAINSRESKKQSVETSEELIQIKDNVQEEATDAVNQAISNINLDSVILKSGKRFIYKDHLIYRDFAFVVDSSGNITGQVVSILPIDTLKKRYKGFEKTEFYKEQIRLDSLKIKLNE